MSRKENYSFLFCPSSLIKLEICYLHEAESSSYCLLLQKTHTHPEDRRSDLEKSGLDLWKIDYKASIHLLSTRQLSPKGFSRSKWGVRYRKYKVARTRFSPGAGTFSTHTNF